jgi:hypothetical protein
VTSQRKEKLRQRWLEVLRAELDRREEGEDGDERREQAIAAIEAELQAIAERLAGVEGPLVEDASIVQRLAVVTYLPHRLTATELEAETAALDAWFRDYASRNRA